MRAKGVLASVLLGAGAVVCTLLLWMLVRGDAGQRDEAPLAVLKRNPAERVAASPTIPVPAAARGTPEPLVAAAPQGSSDAPAAAAAPTLPGEAALFNGRVVDEHGAPIADARVWHVPTRTLRRPLRFVTGRSGIDLAWELLPQTTTDAEGRFTFTSREVARDPEAPPDPERAGSMDGVYGGVLPGLVVRHPAFAIVVHSCTSFRSATYDAGDIVLSPGAALSGRLLSEEGGLVAEASVGPSSLAFREAMSSYGDWYVARHFLQVLSGADGRFLVGSLWPGDAEVQVQHGDFAPFEQRATSRAGEVVDLGDLKLEPARHIRGVVLDKEGQVVRGALLLARASAQRMEAQFGGADPLQQEIGSATFEDVRVTAGADGSFDLGSLSESYYDVFANLPGYEADCARDVQAGTDGVVLRLAPEATLLLTVVDDTDHAPLAGATAHAWRRSDVKSIFGENTSSELVVLAGGDAATAVGQPGDGVGLLVVQRAGSDGTDVVASAPGRATTGFSLPGLRPGERLERTLELAREAVLEGRVENAGHDPVAGASIRLSRAADKGMQFPVRSATSDAAGRFRLDQLLPGAWSLRADAENYVGAGPLQLTVTNDAHPSETVVMLQRGAALKGLLLDADGVPAVDETVELTITNGDWEGRHFQETTDEVGRFAWGAGFPACSAVVRAWPGAEAALTLVAGETAEVTLALRHKPIIRGRVTRGGQPVDKAVIVAVLVTAGSELPTMPAFIGNSRADVQAVTTATGEYTLSTPMQARYVVQARTASARSRGVVVAAEWDREALAELVFGNASLDGLVSDARTGQPISDAELTLHERGYDAAAALAGVQRGAELDQTARTDATGRFTFEQLQPGALVVSVRAAGYASASLEAQLAADGALSVGGAAAARLDFALESGVGLKGTLSMASGKPLYPDTCIGVETASQVATSNVMWFTANSSSIPWTWTMELEPGPCTVKVWRAISTSLGSLAEKDVLASASVSLAAGETSVVDLVIND